MCGRVPVAHERPDAAAFADSAVERGGITAPPGTTIRSEPGLVGVSGAAAFLTVLGAAVAHPARANPGAGEREIPATPGVGDAPQLGTGGKVAFLTVAVIVHRGGREITAGNADVQRNMGIGARQQSLLGQTTRPAPAGAGLTSLRCLVHAPHYPRGADNSAHVPGYELTPPTC